MTPGQHHPTPRLPRPVALVTGGGRTVGTGAGVAGRLAACGWDLAFTHWPDCDRRMAWGTEEDAATEIALDLRERGARALPVEADLTDPREPARVFAEAERRLGPVTALVPRHCESVDSGLLGTTVESFDRHFAINARHLVAGPGVRPPLHRRAGQAAGSSR